MRTEFLQSCPCSFWAASKWRRPTLRLRICWSPSWSLSLGLFFELQEDPRKGPHLPSFPTLLRLGGLFGVFFGFYSLSIWEELRYFFCINQNIWHRLCGIVAAFWRFGIWTKKLLELISSYFHNGNNKDLIKSQNKCHSVSHNIYWTKV